jgi:hypothetical protein
MKTHNDNTPDDEVREERDDPAFDFWSDEGVRIFNDILDEGSAYTPADADLSLRTSRHISRTNNATIVIRISITRTERLYRLARWN